MRKIAIVVAAILLGLPSVTFGTVLLDQSYVAPPYDGAVSFSSVGPTISTAQTFTVGLDGLLSEVDVQVARWQTVTSASSPLILEIHSNSPSDPTVLASADIAPLAPSLYPTSSFVAVDLASAGVMVHTGDVLAITLRVDVSGSGNYYCADSPSAFSGFTGPYYSSGNGWIDLSGT